MVPNPRVKISNFTVNPSFPFASVHCFASLPTRAWMLISVTHTDTYQSMLALPTHPEIPASLGHYVAHILDSLVSSNAFALIPPEFFAPHKPRILPHTVIHAKETKPKGRTGRPTVRAEKRRNADARKGLDEIVAKIEDESLTAMEVDSLLRTGNVAKELTAEEEDYLRQKAEVKRIIPPETIQRADNNLAANMKELARLSGGGAEDDGLLEGMSRIENAREEGAGGLLGLVTRRSKSE